MDKRYLEYILALAETGNITRAARKLYISQPTLSQFLAKQEKELGTPLFQRTGGVYTLTPVGTLYAEYAYKVLEMTNQLENDIKRISNTTRIRIGTSASRALQMVTSILADFRTYYPKVELNFSDDNLRAMSNALTHDEVDIAFVTANTLEPFKGHSIELKREEVVFAAPSIHPHCQSLEPGHHHLDTVMLLKYFGNTPFILQHKGSCIRYLVDALFDNQDFHPIIACSNNHAQTICDMVSNNVGVGFVPIGHASASPQITYFSLEPRIFRIHSILYRKNLILEPPHKYLIELAQNYAKENWVNLGDIV